MNITCVIVDDEKLARDLLQEYLQQMPNLQVLAECSKGKDAVETIDKLKPDLVFLDVQMPGMTGFDVLDEITHDPYIIFCTAYDQYAIKAFEKNAVDYILKPLDQERFKLGVERAIARMKMEQNNVGELLRNQPTHDVVAAARRIGNDHPQRPAGVALLRDRRSARAGEQGERACTDELGGMLHVDTFRSRCDTERDR